MYICGGKDEDHGKVWEVRYGAEAQVGWTVNHPDSNTVDHMWALEIPINEELLIITSHTTHTTVLAFGLETQELAYANTESHPGFDFESPTLAVTTVDKDMVVQVTPKGINTIPSDKPSYVSRLEIHQAEILEGNNIVALAQRMPDATYQITLATIPTPSHNNVRLLSEKRPTALTNTPISLVWLIVHDSPILMVGTDRGELLAYCVLPDKTLRLLSQWQVKDLDPRIENAAVVSMAWLNHRGEAMSLLLCGLRNGLFLCLEVTPAREGGKLSMKNISPN
jgi:hypothetical protein